MEKMVFSAIFLSSSEAFLAVLYIPGGKEACMTPQQLIGVC